MLNRLGSLLLVALVLAAFLASSGCTSYAKEVRNSLKKVYPDYNKYSFRATPVGNFGAGTMYFVDQRGNANPDGDWIAASTDSWWADGVSVEDKKLWLGRIIQKGGFGSVSLDRDISTKLGLTAVVPNIEAVVDVSAGLDFEKGVKVTLSSQSTSNRRIDWMALQLAIRDKVIHQDVVGYLNASEVLVGAADIILDGYTATVEVDERINPKLEAALSKAATEAAGLGEGTGLKLNLERVENGNYKVQATDPVVAAVLYLLPPRRGTTPKSDQAIFIDLYDWQPTKLSAEFLQTAEARRVKAAATDE